MKSKISKIILTSLALMLLALLFYKLYLDYRPEIDLLMHLNKNTERDLVKEVRSHGFMDAFILFVATTLAEAVPGLSNGVLCIVNGLLYGSVLGFLISWCAGILGQGLLLLGMSFIFKKPTSVGKNSKLLARLGKDSNPWLSLTFAYFLPFIPNVSVNYANLHMLRRLWPVIIGTAPLAALYAFVGDAILKWNKKRLVAFVVIILICLLIYALLRWYHTKKKGNSLKLLPQGLHVARISNFNVSPLSIKRIRKR